MKKFLKQAIGIDQGEAALFSDYEDGGDMWTGNGPRERRLAVKFRESYQSPPVVHVALSMWDMDSATNARADISAENITAEGFDMVFKTWGDSRIARARARWMAMGAVAHDDDWQLY